MKDLLRFVGLLGTERRRLLRGLVLSLALSIGSVALSVLGALVVGRAVAGDPVAPTTAMAVLWTLAVLVAFATWRESHVSHVLAYRLLATLRMRLYDAFARLAPAGLRDHRSGDLTARVVHDVESLEWLFAHTVVQSASATAVWVGGLVGTWVIDPALLVVLVPAAAAIAVVPALTRRRADLRAEEVRAELGTLRSDLVETVQGATELVVAGAMPARRTAIERSGARLARAQQRSASWAGLESGLVEAMLGIAALAAVLVVSLGVSRGSVEPAMAPVAMVLVATVLGPMAQVASLVRHVGSLRASLRRLVELLDAAEAVPEPPPSGPTPDPTQGIRVRGVHFAHPGGPPVLSGVDLDVPMGRTVALVGESGSGKTTLVHILLRLAGASSGSVEVGGVPIDRISEADLRRFVAPVLQDVDVFHGTIADNIRLSRHDASDARVAAAATASRLDEVISDLPLGLETVIGERGSGLSGGQRARVAIARALLADAPVLLLDEAFAHLDPRLEDEVTDFLRAAYRDRAVLVVAHRPGTIATADEVVTLAGGRLSRPLARPRPGRQS